MTIRERLSLLDSAVIKYEIIPDEMDIITSKLTEWADAGDVDVILTTGGTGLSPRDITPEATLGAVDRVVPGLVETMSGIRGRCLIINLPGSTKAVRECLEVVLPIIPHAVEIIKGEVTEHSAGPQEGSG
jgi:molybdenum cofactor synthesis domain-containing protein